MKDGNFLLILLIMMSIGSGIGAAKMVDRQLIVSPKVCSSQSVDLSSLDAIMRGIIKPGMSDREKAVAVWRFMHFHTYGGVYPTEQFGWWGSCFDPVKALNMYPWGDCGWQQFTLSQLWKAAGLSVRCKVVGKTKPADGHWITEVHFDDAWHYLDSSIDFYLMKRDGKTIAEIDDLCTDHSLITDPSSTEGLLDGKTADYLKRLTGYYKHTRPSRCPSRKGNHSMVINLARGDEYVLSCEKQGTPEWSTCRYWYFPPNLPREIWKRCEKRQRYPLGKEGDVGPRGQSGSRANRYRPLDGFSNSKLIYTPDFRTGSYVDRVVKSQNMSPRLKPYLHPRNHKQPAYVVFEIQSPYVMVAGSLQGIFIKTNEQDSNAISVSTDSGKTWEKAWTNDNPGKSKIDVDITPHIYGAYKYWIRFEFLAHKKNTDAGIDSLRLTTIFQSSPASVPRLGRGENTITVTVDNPDILNRCRLEVEYCWAQGNPATRRVIQKKHRKRVTGSPMKYTIRCRDGEPTTRYVRMTVSEF